MFCVLEKISFQLSSRDDRPSRYMEDDPEVFEWTDATDGRSTRSRQMSKTGNLQMAQSQEGGVTVQDGFPFSL